MKRVAGKEEAVTRIPLVVEPVVVEVAPVVVLVEIRNVAVTVVVERERAAPFALEAIKITAD